jgi:GNAT superfamily N-acetyltransferase
MIKIIEENLFAKFAYLPNLLGDSQIIQQPLVTLINSRLPSSMFNIVCNARFYEEAKRKQDIGTHRYGEAYIHQEVQNAIAFFKTENLPFTWWIGPSSTPDDLDQYLMEEGLILESEEQAMVLQVDSLITQKPPLNLTIDCVYPLPSKRLCDFAKILGAYDETAITFYDKIAGIPCDPSAPCTLFVGYVNQQPVAIGSLFFTQTLAGIFDLLTLENYRGHGYGTAMMQSMILFARNRGYHHIGLSASSFEGVRIYERLGFKTCGQFMCYTMPQN